MSYNFCYWAIEGYRTMSRSIVWGLYSGKKGDGECWCQSSAGCIEDAVEHALEAEKEDGVSIANKKDMQSDVEKCKGD